MPLLYTLHAGVSNAMSIRGHELNKVSKWSIKTIFTNFGLFFAFNVAFYVNTKQSYYIELKIFVDTKEKKQ